MFEQFSELPAVLLAGCLEFVILDTKLQGRAIYL